MSWHSLRPAVLRGVCERVAFRAVSAALRDPQVAVKVHKAVPELQDADREERRVRSHVLCPPWRLWSSF